MRKQEKMLARLLPSFPRAFALMAAARALASTRDWRCLAATATRLPEFARTLAFSEREDVLVYQRAKAESDALNDGCARPARDRVDRHIAWAGATVGKPSRPTVIESNVLTGVPVMKIGTPLSRSATRVMLLGGGELGKEVVIALQRYGIEVIAVDRYPDAPAHQVAHRAYAVDMTDGAVVQALVEKERPHLVIPEIEAIATEALLELEQAGVTEVMPTARAICLTMDRRGIRRLAAEELGLPTSTYTFADSYEEFIAAVSRIGFPCFIKPIMSSSGKGQSMLRSSAELEGAWLAAQTSGRVKKAPVIVEGKIEFEYEITLLTVRAINASGQVETRFCEPIGHVQQNGDYVESWQPQPMNAMALSEAQRIARAVTDSLGGRGIFGVELFVAGNQVWFSEVSPRPHDTGMVTMITQAQSEFELHARAVLGLPVNTVLRNPGASAVIYGGLEAEGIAFEGLDNALSLPDTEIRLFGKPVSHARRRMGVALAAGSTVEAAREVARATAARVQPVID